MNLEICDVCGTEYEEPRELETKVCDDCITHYSHKALSQEENYQILVNEGN